MTIFFAFCSLTGSNSKADMGHVIGKSFARGAQHNLELTQLVNRGHSFFYFIFLFQRSQSQGLFDSHVCCCSWENQRHTNLLSFLRSRHVPICVTASCFSRLLPLPPTINQNQMQKQNLQFMGCVWNKTDKNSDQSLCLF